MKYQETLNTIYARLDRLGDLPVFSATVNQIRQISSASDTDAITLKKQDEHNEHRIKNDTCPM